MSNVMKYLVSKLFIAILIDVIEGKKKNVNITADYNLLNGSIHTVCCVVLKNNDQ